MAHETWRTSDLIVDYWTMETDEELRLPSADLPPKVQAEWYSYRLGAMANGGKILYSDPSADWGEWE